MWLALVPNQSCWIIPSTKFWKIKISVNLICWSIGRIFFELNIVNIYGICYIIISISTLVKNYFTIFCKYNWNIEWIIRLICHTNDCCWKKATESTLTITGKLLLEIAWTFWRAFWSNWSNSYFHLYCCCNQFHTSCATVENDALMNIILPPCSTAFFISDLYFFLITCSTISLFNDSSPNSSFWNQ